MSACKDGSGQHFFTLGADRCSCCGWNRYAMRCRNGCAEAKPSGLERGTAVHTKLAAIAGRSTKYEIILVHDDGRRRLLGYGRKTRPGILAMVSRRAVELSTFCGDQYVTLKGLPAGTTCKIGGWSIRATARTERQAIIEGELKRWDS